MTSVVAARQLSRRFGRHWALRSVDLELRAAEAVALLGANGAGKSTLLSILATLLRPSEGEVELFGRAAFEHRDEVRARVGYLPHSTLLDDALSARENLDFYAALFGVDNSGQKVLAQLEAVGLAERSEDRVGGFSRGMRQRLSLARALLHQPDLLFLDEPFTGLDAPGVRDLSARLAEEKRGGRAMVIVTHQLDPVLDWCDRVVVLHRGKLIEDTPAAARDLAGWTLRLSEIAEGHE